MHLLDNEAHSSSELDGWYHWTLRRINYKNNLTHPSTELQHLLVIAARMINDTMSVKHLVSYGLVFLYNFTVFYLEYKSSRSKTTHGKIKTAHTKVVFIITKQREFKASNRNTPLAANHYSRVERDILLYCMLIKEWIGPITVIDVEGRTTAFKNRIVKFEKFELISK